MVGPLGEDAVRGGGGGLEGQVVGGGGLGGDM